MSLNEKLVIELTENEVQNAISWWVKNRYKDDPRGEVSVGTLKLETEIRELGQGRIEPRFKCASGNIWFNERTKK